MNANLSSKKPFGQIAGQGVSDQSISDQLISGQPSSGQPICDQYISNTTDLSTATDWIERGKQVLMSAYASFPVVVESGTGCYVHDINGKTYLDFVAGVAVNCLGHGDSDHIKTIAAQLNKLIHCSNLYWNTPAIELAEILVKESGLNKVFFCNSGSEAMETALKLCRKFAKQKGAEVGEVITMDGSFHGRTYGALSATAQRKYHAGFEPMLPGFKSVPLNDFAALAQAITPKTCAIFIEPIQGESGIHTADAQYLKQVRSLCTEKQIGLVFDEVQCGIGRTGKLFAYQDLDVMPDVLALAKGLGGGFPIGAVLVNKEMSSVFQPGDHGCTFGGNPLACSAALAVLQKLLKPEMMSHVIEMGDALRNGLLALQKKHQLIIAVRGKGLMQAIELEKSVRSIIERCVEKGLLLASASQNVIRFVPPLIIKTEEIQSGLNILDAALSESISLDK